MEEKRKRIRIPLETKKLIYRASKHDNVSINEISQLYGIDKKSIYSICHKLSNDPDLNLITTDSSNNGNEKSIDEKPDSIKRNCL